jgi:sugar O-acyltransferase (sialic acid O-acetyltransferase NeuD family)
VNSSNNNLLIIGAGQYGRVAFEIAEAMGCFGKVSFLDDSYSASTEDHAIIGTSSDIEKFATDYHYCFVAIGNPEVRRHLTESLCSGGYTLATLIHPTAYVSPSAQLKPGCCVEPLAVVQTGAALGTATFVASGTVIRHNASVGDFCHVDCNAVVETCAVVSDNTKIPCNSVFRKEQIS